MRDESSREPLGNWNAEGAPQLKYEVWDWVDSDKYWQPLDPDECYWRFIGYRVLSLRQLLKYQEFGYHVERSRSDDRGGTSPLFPRVAATRPAPEHGMDPVPVPEPGPPGG